MLYPIPPEHDHTHNRPNGVQDDGQNGGQNGVQNGEQDARQNDGLGVGQSFIPHLGPALVVTLAAGYSIVVDPAAMALVRMAASSQNTFAISGANSENPNTTTQHNPNIHTSIIQSTPSS